jgi:xanthine dehydrogenase small subunit
LDIASVNSACSAVITEDIINNIHISAGGVAPFPKYLAATSTFLSGKKLETQTLKDAFKIMNEEISPISDARGSADYKRLLLHQLCIGHLLKFFGPVQPLKDLLHQ